MNTNKTLDELRNAVQTEMQLDPGLISEEERTRFINDCLADLGKLSGFEKYVEIPLDENGEATLPRECVDIIMVVADNHPLRPVSLTSKSRGYTLTGDVLRVSPKTTGVVGVYYSYKPTMLVNGTDKPDIPNGYDDCIIDYAVAKAHRKNGNISLSREYMASYESLKQDLSQELLRRENSRVLEMHNSDYPDTRRFIGEEIIF